MVLRRRSGKSILLITFCTSVLLTFIMYTRYVPQTKERVIHVEVSTHTTLKVTTPKKKDPRIITKAEIRKSGVIFPSNGSVPMTINSKFRIPNPNICSRFLSVTYVILVHSAPGNFERRMSMRQTWASNSVFANITSRTVFLLGSTYDLGVQSEIDNENRIHGDIVQGDFKDDYKNLTLKAVLGLRWITENCPNAEYVIKVDDDVFVNIFEVKRSCFPELSHNGNQIICSVEPHATIFRPGNPYKELVKWFIDESYFTKLKKYPMPFCYGYATFYTSTMAIKLFEMAKSTPFFRLDDVYVYGVLASKIPGLVWRNEGDKFFKEEESTKKAFKPDSKTIPWVGTARSAKDMQELWTLSKSRAYRRYNSLFTNSTA